MRFTLYLTTVFYFLINSGSFNMFGKRHDILDGLKGHVSSRACQKVYDEISLFQQDLHLKMLPQSEVWPKRFELSDPNEEDIAVFFFPSKIRWLFGRSLCSWSFFPNLHTFLSNLVLLFSSDSEPAYDQLIDEMRDNDLALKGVVQNAEILIFTSMVLPLLYWSKFDSNPFQDLLIKPHNFS